MKDNDSPLPRNVCENCGVEYGIPGLREKHEAQECLRFQALTVEEKRKLWVELRIAFPGRTKA